MLTSVRASSNVLQNPFFARVMILVEYTATQLAKEAYARSGADTSLDDVGKQAGVGAGTLYRHLPARDALLEAVYRTEVEKLAAEEWKPAQALPPIEALRACMLCLTESVQHLLSSFESDATSAIYN